MAVDVVGGVYREVCHRPPWDEIYGSGGRAACALAKMGTAVTLHAYAKQHTGASLHDHLDPSASALLTFSLSDAPLPEFRYLHALASPTIVGRPRTPYPTLTVESDRAVRFGMLEATAVVKAEWAVFDPQNHRNAESFRENGSEADHLALVMNLSEARRMSGLWDKDPEVVAARLADQEAAEVVVLKMGPRGALVWTYGAVTEIPAYRTRQVWKVGSGDCFVAHFARAWMDQGLTAAKAAEAASIATAVYCDTRVLPDQRALDVPTYLPIEMSVRYRTQPRRKVYLAGPFFDIAQLWLVEETVHELRDIGLEVLSPFHDIGLGPAEVVVHQDLRFIDDADLVLALADGLDSGTVFEVGYAVAKGKPVVVFSERESAADLKMMLGSDCVLCNEYALAIYSTFWEAARL